MPVDWKARAEREAAAILHAKHANDCGPGSGAYTYPALVNLLAIAWLQGTIYGSHETLAQAEQGFERLRNAL